MRTTFICLEILRCLVYQLALLSDINECSAALSDCDANADCQNNQGSFSCSCKAGFTGDGKTCTAGKGSVKFKLVGVVHGKLEVREDIKSHSKGSLHLGCTKSGNLSSHRNFIESLHVLVSPISRALVLGYKT